MILKNFFCKYYKKSYFYYKIMEKTFIISSDCFDGDKQSVKFDSIIDFFDFKSQLFLSPVL